MSMKLKSLAEALKSLSKYPDRPIIDYWRTIQGTNVGFHGDPKAGVGIPIAGPPILTGGSASGNPLLEPILKKYKAGTFVGDAVRKKNFPLSAINFIENFVGKDNDEIEARIAKMDKVIDDEIMPIMGRKIYDYKIPLSMKGVPVMDDTGKQKVVVPIYYSESSKQFVSFMSHDADHTPESQDILKRLNAANAENDANKVLSIINEAMRLGSNREYDLSDFVGSIFNESFTSPPPSRKKNARAMIKGHFSAPSGPASVIYQLMKLEGVAGTLKGGGYPDAGIGKDKDQVSEYLENLTTDYETAREVLGDMYAMNQAVLRRKGITTEKITRGMGDTLAGMESFSGSATLAKELDENGVSMRFLNRPASGFAEGDHSVFTGWTVQSDIPVEASLSSFVGLRFQETSFDYERETIVIGAASLAFTPDQITYVSGSASDGYMKYSVAEVSAASDKAKKENSYAWIAPSMLPKKELSVPAKKKE